jgi:type IV secretory pathway VirB2 component (pilin)
MKLFPKSFFALFFTIFLLSSKSATAAFAKQKFTVVSGTVCADLCTTPSDACGSGETTADAITLNFAGTGSPINIPCSTSAPANTMKGLCEASCVIAKAAVDAAVAADAAYKAKLDPMGDAKYDIQDQTFSRAMCQALKVVTGSAGKTFASFAIIATGIGFFTGKVSWGLMIGVTAGIATMFGAPSIVAAISGQNTDMNCSAITK